MRKKENTYKEITFISHKIHTAKLQDMYDRQYK